MTGSTPRNAMPPFNSMTGPVTPFNSMTGPNPMPPVTPFNPRMLSPSELREYLNKQQQIRLFDDFTDAYIWYSRYIYNEITKVVGKNGNFCIVENYRQLLTHRGARSNVKISTYFTGFWDKSTHKHQMKPFTDCGIDELMFGKLKSEFGKLSYVLTEIPCANQGKDLRVDFIYD